MSIKHKADEGKYANVFKVGHNSVEFVIEFGQQYDEDTVYHTRIITSPAYIKELLNVINDSEKSFSENNNKINISH